LQERAISVRISATAICGHGNRRCTEPAKPSLGRQNRSKAFHENDALMLDLMFPPLAGS